MSVGKDNSASVKDGGGNFLSSFLNKLKDKDRENREREDRAYGLGGAEAAASSSPVASPSPSSAAAVAAATGPDSQQAALVAAALQRKEKADASASTKAKFLGLFKSDAEKRAEKEQAAAAKARAHESAAQAAAAQAAALEPIKLDLHCAESRHLAPMVGRAIRASAMRGGSGSSSSHAIAIGVGSRGVCRWFRAGPDGSFDQIAETVAPLYVPTIDDLDCRVCCQWVEQSASASAGAGTEQDASAAAAAASSSSTAADGSAAATPAAAPLQSSFAELGPVLMDPSLLTESLDVFQKGKAFFSNTHEQDSDELVSFTVKRTMIRILGGGAGGGGGGGGGGGEVKASFILKKPANATDASNVQLLLDPVDPLRFTLEDTSAASASHATKVFRGYIAAEGESLAQYAQARRQRDVMACLIRRILRTGSEALPAPTTTTAEEASAPQHSSSSALTTAPDSLLRVELHPALTDSGDFVQLSISPTPAPPALVTASASSAAREHLTPLVLPTTTHATPISSASSLSPHPPSSSSSSASSAASVSSLSKRVSELTAEKNLFRENLNLILLDKSSSESASAARIAALETTLANRDSELAALRRTADQSSEDVDSLKIAIQTLSTQMSTLANTEIRLSGEVRLLKNERESLQEELKSTRESAARASEDHEVAQARLVSESRAFQSGQVSAQSECSALRSEVGRLRSLEGQLLRAQEAEANLKHDLGVLKADIVRRGDVQAKLDRIEMENHALRKEKEQMNKKIRNMEATATATGAAPGGGVQDSPVAAADPSSSSSSTAASDDSLAPPAASAAVDSLTSDSAALPAATLNGNGRDPSSPAATAAASPDSAATTAQAFLILKDQHGRLQSEYDLLGAAHAKSLASLSDALGRLATLEASQAESAAALHQLQQQHATLQSTHEETLANRNYFKRKCESLASSVDKMLKAEAEAAAATAEDSSSRGTPRGLTPSSSMSKLNHHGNGSSSEREVVQLRATVAQLRNECSELQRTLEAYVKTMQANHALLKAEREANLMLSSKAGSSGSSHGGLFSRGSKAALAAQQAQFDSVRSLANSLSELISDKDLSIAHLKKSNLILSKRVHDLEVKFEDELEREGDTHLSFGKVHLEQLEQDEGKARLESANKSRRNSKVGSVSGQQQLRGASSTQPAAAAATTDEPASASSSSAFTFINP